MSFKAETHYMCDKLLRHIAATRLLPLMLSLGYVAQIQTSLDSCDRSQRQNHVEATIISTLGDLLQQTIRGGFRIVTEPRPLR